jgi:endo-1,4-beta-xylanase
LSGGSGAFGAAGSGGNATGGNATGGNATGGANNGGSANGGAANGGAANGGAANGGAANGGKAGGGGAGGGTTTPDCSSAALTGGAQHCSSNASGTLGGGYAWTIWSSGSGGCLTTYGKDAAFKATWTNSGDFLSRVGLQWDETKTYDSYGTIAADYSYAKTGSAGGYSFIGIYGWSNNPLVEYYIVDDWFGSGPPTGGGTLKGTLMVDGGTYNIYTHTQNNQPSIHGTQTFPQFFSVRQTARQCGHISITEHFKKWAALGMNLGKMYEAKLLIEAGGGTGSIDYKVANLTAK